MGNAITSLIYPSILSMSFAKHECVVASSSKMTRIGATRSHMP